MHFSNLKPKCEIFTLSDYYKKIIVSITDWSTKNNLKCNGPFLKWTNFIYIYEKQGSSCFFTELNLDLRLKSNTSLEACRKIGYLRHWLTSGQMW